MGVPRDLDVNPRNTRGHNKRFLLESVGKDLTFFVDYENDQFTDLSKFYPDYVMRGSHVGTFTRTACNATYIDANGVIQLQANANIPRYAKGYYDETGFHSIPGGGLMVEAAMTNRATYSGTPENAAWTKTNITADNDDTGSSSPDGTATSNRLLATANNGTFVQAYPITGAAATYTASCWLKRKTGTGIVNLGAVEDGTGKAAKTITTSWTFHSVTATTDGDDAGKDPAFYLELESDTDAVYIYGMQLEAGPYPTSHCPSVTSAGTRNAETLKYAIAGNRTAATETIAIKFMPLGAAFANTGISRYCIDSDTKQRSVVKTTTGTQTAFFPNLTDDAGSNSGSTTVPQSGISYVAVGSCSATGNPNVSLYINSILESASSTTDFTPNAWGTNFYIGSDKGDGTTGTKQFNGLIQSVAIFSNAKSAPDVAKITGILNS